MIRRNNEPIPHRFIEASCLILFFFTLSSKAIFAETNNQSIAIANVALTKKKPWRVHEAIHSPSWLQFGLEHRLRFEYLLHDPRATSFDIDSSGFFLRTIGFAELNFSPVSFFLEIEDARVYPTSQFTLTNAMVDVLELLQVKTSLHFEDALFPGDKVSFNAGRLTLDLGSRRLVARNEFRNTINSFTGIDALWLLSKSHVIRLFAVVPVMRLPAQNDDLAKNKIQFDQENTNTFFWGGFYAYCPPIFELRIETYVFGLHERDSPSLPSANRQLVTAGLRVFRLPELKRFDFDVELMAQVGESHATTSDTDRTPLLHFAASGHASAGLFIHRRWQPKIRAQYDFASGDRNPEDKQNNRFDPLYGARRFEFGPTGLYGLLARSNLHSPGIRFELNPSRNIDIFLAYRAGWLFSSRDSWPGLSWRDTSGKSGSFIGHQIETRLRWHILPKNIVWEIGAAYFIINQSQEARSLDKGNPLYLYTQVTARI